MVYLTVGVLIPEGMHFLQNGKRFLAQELAGLIDRALNWIGRQERIKPRLPVISDGMAHQNLRN